MSHHSHSDDDDRLLDDDTTLDPNTQLSPGTFTSQVSTRLGIRSFTLRRADATDTNSNKVFTDAQYLAGTYVHHTKSNQSSLLMLHIWLVCVFQVHHTRNNRGLLLSFTDICT